MNLTANLPNIPLNIPIDAQEILAQISNNTNHIELLTRNNTLLVQYLLTRGVEHTHLDTVRHNPVLREMLMHDNSQQAGYTQQPKQLAAPARRGRPPQSEKRAQAGREYFIHAGSKIGWIIEFAREHGGIFDAHIFREDFRQRGRQPESFAQTTMYSVCNSLARRGILEKLTPTTYRLVDDTHGPPKAAAPEPVIPPPPPPPVPLHAHPLRKGLIPGRPNVARRDDILAFARAHKGVFAVQAARKAWAKRKDIPRTYPKTTVFTDLKTLEIEGIAKKTAPGVYQFSA